MKKGVVFGILILLLAGFALAQSTNPWSSDASGKEKNNFTNQEKVYVKGISICDAASSALNLYIVNHKSWQSGDSLTDVRGNPRVVQTDASAALATILVWDSPKAGGYDIIIDCNNNSKYDTLEDIDSLSAIGFYVKGSAGKGSVSIGNFTPLNHAWRYDAANPQDYNEMLQLTLKAENETISLKDIGLLAKGVGNDLQVDKIEVYVDDGNGRKDDSDVKIGEISPAYAADNSRTTISLSYDLSGETSILLVYYMKQDSLNNYSFSVESVSGTGKDSQEAIRFSGLPLNSAVKTVFEKISCVGNLSILFDPLSAEAGSSVISRFYGLAGCYNKTARVQKTPCDANVTNIVCSCVIEDFGCECSFNAESSATYYGCIDKNNNGNMIDAGESISAAFTVTPKAEVSNENVSNQQKPGFSLSSNMTTLIIAGVVFFTVLLLVILVVLIVIASKLSKNNVKKV